MFVGDDLVTVTLMKVPDNVDDLEPLQVRVPHRGHQMLEEASAGRPLSGKDLGFDSPASPPAPPSQPSPFEINTCVGSSSSPPGVEVARP